MKKSLLFSTGLLFAFILNAQNNVFNRPVQIIDGTQGDGKVLTSDSTGLGTSTVVGRLTNNKTEGKFLDLRNVYPC